MTIWARTSRYSPVLCRLLARHRYGPPLTGEEIARRSGLSEFEVNTISRCTSWQGIDVDTMRRFMQACQTDVDNRQQMHRIENYLRRPTFAYLKRSPLWKTVFKPLMKLWLEAQTRKP
jgi:hypothetical protein